MYRSKLERMKALGMIHMKDGEGEGGGGGPTAEEFAALQTQLADLTASSATMQTENERLTAKIGEANKHAKAAEALAAKEAAAKAQASGDFEQLHKSSETAREALQKQLDDVMGNVANEKRNNSAMKLASELAEGPNVDLLSQFIAPRLKYTDDGIKVTNASGELTVSTLEDLKKEFEGDVKYASLLKGSKASGGGAQGGGEGGGAAQKQIDRAEFNALSLIGQAEFIKSGGTVTT